MQLWEERARHEVSASMHQNSLVLQNSLPQYLNHLVDALSTQIERTSARMKPIRQKAIALVNSMDVSGRVMPITL
jgi:hypothetical protein